MVESEIILQILQNPVILGLLIAVIRNIGGYIEDYLRARSTGTPLKYDLNRFGETVALYETLFITLSYVAGLPVPVTAALTVIIDALRSLKKVISDMNRQ